MAIDFNSIIRNLDDIGFYDVALPFLLIFTIVFAILQKIKIFGDNSKNFNAIIALAFAFLVVRQSNIIEVVNLFLPKISLMALIIISVLLLLGVLLSPKKVSGLANSWIGGVGVILTLAGIAFSFIGSSGALGIRFPTWLSLARDDMYLLLGIAIFILFVWFITADPKQSGPDIGGFLEKLSKQIGGND